MKLSQLVCPFSSFYGCWTLDASDDQINFDQASSSPEAGTFRTSILNWKGISKLEARCGEDASRMISSFAGKSSSPTKGRKESAFTHHVKLQKLQSHRDTRASKLAGTRRVCIWSICAVQGASRGGSLRSSIARNDKKHTRHYHCGVYGIKL